MTTSIRIAKESLEDYTLRYAPRSYRRWSPGVVAISALGGIAYLADFSIGAGIGLANGTRNALWGIVIFAIVVMITGYPLALYAAKYNIDLDLITRGSGFGYYGSVLTNLVFASFTFIFFATEGSIMAQGLNLGLHITLWLGYLISSLIIIPLVMYGMKALSKLQLWTTPLWLLMMVIPFIYLLISQPQALHTFWIFAGRNGDTLTFSGVMLSAGVCLSLIAQIAEQIDYLRFMPPKTPENKRAWWISTLIAGPGWVLFGAAKQIIGLYLAIYIVTVVPTKLGVADHPVEQFVETYKVMHLPVWLAIALAVILVVISQIKINVTNAYSGSLAWTNSFTRLTKHYPGRVVFLFVNIGISLLLMEFNMFAFLNSILNFYANCAIAWIMVVASDIVINKWILKISPLVPEFRRGMLYAINPVGFISFIVAALGSIAVYFGFFGLGMAPYSPIIAAIIGVILPPIIALITQGKYYLRRKHDGIDLPFFDEHGNPSGELLTCVVTGLQFERPDMIASAMVASDGNQVYISSLALSCDRSGLHILPEH